jgi:succinate dehydrogenase / fumarate reductase cytochrome b subunit
MTATTNRPLSPHITAYKWGPHMIVSILHRLTGSALTLAGLGLLAWWLTALALGGETHATFEAATGHLAGLIVLVGLTWASWQHFFSGLRHLVMDMGAGYELKVNRFWAVMTLAASLLATAATWYIAMGVGQ